MAEPAQAPPVARVRARRRIVVDAPDLVSATDLADRLRAYAPLLSSNGDGCRLTIPHAGGRDAVRTMLASVEQWARHWDLAEVPVGIGERTYTLDSRRTAAPRRPDRPRPKLLFFHSPRSGQCRRAEALVAQVLQRRRNHDTFELVRVSVDRRPDLAERLGVDEVPAVVVIDGGEVAARLRTPRHSHEIEHALRRWLR
ncbi:MAG TPA: thioredoxin family protein [Gaiellaceae bacterium]|jgi:hypothetical protein|nr:thioredoxin family protein [Gaiellaceae bacterium]